MRRLVMLWLGLITFSAAKIIWAGALSSSAPVTTMSAASYDGRAVAPGSIVASFGQRLATETVSAIDSNPNLPGIQLPASLGGTSAEVNGRLAGLLFVSPAQINYILPPETEVGAANIVVRASDGTVSSGTTEVQRVAPGIFCANSNGRDVPAAELQRLRGGTATSETPAQCASGNCVARPIDLGPEGEQLVLMLYLTGLRNSPDADGDGNARECARVVGRARTRARLRRGAAELCRAGSDQCAAAARVGRQWLGLADRDCGWGGAFKLGAPERDERGAYTLVITAVSELGRVATHRLALTVE